MPPAVGVVLSSDTSDGVEVTSKGFMISADLAAVLAEEIVRRATLKLKEAKLRRR